KALRYFWQVLDVNKTGRLTISTINLFFRDIVAKLAEGGFDPPNVMDVKDEIFDMVKPAERTCITLEDLILSGVGHTVVSMLIDVNGFWAYDNRESIISDPEDTSSTTQAQEKDPGPGPGPGPGPRGNDVAGSGGEENRSSEALAWTQVCLGDEELAGG
ncbi:unnamed protein product, partial [Discosporangium mesarthrocarpum]